MVPADSETGFFGSHRATEPMTSEVCPPADSLPSGRRMDKKQKGLPESRVRENFFGEKRFKQGEFRQRSAPFAQEALEYNMRCRNFPRDPALTSGRSCGRIGVQRAEAERDGRRKAGLVRGFVVRKREKGGEAKP